MEYNFTTRQLYPYSDKWDNGMKGALWYIWEEDALCIANDEEAFPIAKGYAAALFANRELHKEIAQNPVEFYNAYNQQLEKSNFPDRQPFHEARRILYDWRDTLKMLSPIKQDFSHYVDMHARVFVGLILKKYFNPCYISDVKDIIQSKYPYACRTLDNEQWIFSFSYPSNANPQQMVPLIWFKRPEETCSEARELVHGFLAVVLSYAIYQYWLMDWQRMNFANQATIEHYISSINNHGLPIDIAPLSNLNLALPVKITDICQAYMDVYFPIMRAAWEKNPKVPIECLKEEYIYSYLYNMECEAMNDFFHSAFLRYMTKNQLDAFQGYGKRFVEYLTLNYPISYSSSHRITDILGKDLPPIQVTIQNDIKVTHANEQPQKAKPKPVGKFKYIISDDRKEIEKIHKRIELYLSSPAKLRDELRRLQGEDLVALPMENPTAIVRALQQVWGDRAPKEGSFKTTWGRVKC